MPINLQKSYNSLLDIAHMTPHTRNESLNRIFSRDFVDQQPVKFNQKNVYPTKEDDEIKFDLLFRHLTTIKVCPITKRREFNLERSLRLHWVKYHIDQKCDTVVFSFDEPDGIRTYIYNKLEKYVVVLEPLRDRTAYYLLSAYNLTGKDAKRDKMMNKFKKRRLPEIY